MEVRPMHAVKFSLFLPTGYFAEARAAAEWASCFLTPVREPALSL
jgi:hypothetical protein